MGNKMTERNDLNGTKGASGSLVPAAKVLAAGFGWGIIGVFSRPLSEAGLSAVQTTLVRCVIVAAGMAFYLLLNDRSQFRIRWKDLWMFLGTGLLSIVFFNICYFMTIQRATLAAASILLYTAPCFVLLMSAVLFHEKITLQKLMALLLAFGGCALVSGFTGGAMAPTAILTGIGSGLGYALYSIFGSVALKRYRPFTVIFYTFLIATLGILPLANPAGTWQALTDSGRTLGCGLALGVISTFLPFVFYTGGLKEMEAGKASVLAFAEPMVATLAGIVIYHEALQVQNVLGIGMILAAIVLLGRK